MYLGISAAGDSRWDSPLLDYQDASEVVQDEVQERPEPPDMLKKVLLRNQVLDRQMCVDRMALIRHCCKE